MAISDDYRNLSSMHDRYVGSSAEMRAGGMMNYGGIDNGNEGALVLLRSDMTVYEANIMPTINIGRGRQNKWVLDKVAFLAILARWQTYGPLFVVLEKSQPMPKIMRGVSGAWKSGRDYGCAEMALAALRIPHEIVHPRTWQTARLKGIEGRDTKARSVLQCQRTIPDLDLYPGRKRKPHDGLADAANMAAHGILLRPPAPPPPVLPRSGGRRLPPPPPLRRR